jgi:hypothetical protein
MTRYIRNTHQPECQLLLYYKYYCPHRIIAAVEFQQNLRRSTLKSHLIIAIQLKRVVPRYHSVVSALPHHDEVPPFRPSPTGRFLDRAW